MSAARSAAAPPLLALAGLVIAGALGVSEGLYDPWALALVTAATAIAGLGLLAAGRPEEVPPESARWTTAVLGLGVAGSLLFDALFLPGITVKPELLGPFRPALLAVALLAATHLWPRPPPWLSRWRFPLLVAGWLVMAALVIRASPWPGIDVWELQQAGAQSLLRGLNPYALGYRNPYGPDTYVLAREMLSPDGRYILAFPYPPLTLLLDLPGFLAGDVRWTFVAATAAAALLVRELGRRSRAAELAATVLLLQPRTLMVMELSWTEPVALAAVAGAALLLARQARSGLAAEAPPGGWVAAGLALGLAAATKQYVLLLLLPVWRLLSPRTRWRTAALGAAAGAATLLPFLAIHPRGLWRGVVAFQVAQPFRPDAVSWPAAVVAWGGPRLPIWPSFVVAALALAWAVRRARSVGEALAGGALAWLLLVLFNKQAFCNYYWLAAGLLLAAAGALAAPDPAPGATRQSSMASTTPEPQDQGR